MISMEPSLLILHETAENDLPALAALWNDPAVMRWVGFPEGLGYSVVDMQRWFRALRSSPHRHHFVVSAERIGFCGELYYAVDPAHRRASLDIKFCPSAQGRGLATIALQALIRRVFDREPAVDEVWTEPSEENGSARRLYERCGLTPGPRPADMPPGLSYWVLRRPV